MVSTTRSMTWRSDVSRPGVPSVPRKYFCGDDVGRVHRPRHRELDAELLERDGAVLPVRDAGVAALPHDLVEGVDPGRREQSADADAESFWR